MIPAEAIKRISSGGVPADVNPGEVIVLSVHRGDMRLKFDSDDPAEVEQARIAIQDMLKRGYMIFVDTSDDRSGEGLLRVHSFDPTRNEYIVRVDKRSKAYKEAQEVGEKPPKEKRVPATKARATAVAPTSGG
jgi:hypothetical protein